MKEQSRKKGKRWIGTIGIIVACLSVGVVAGATFAPIAFNAFSENANYGSLTVGNTIYQGTVSVNLVTHHGPGSCTADGSTITSVSRSNDVYVPGTPTAACPASKDYYEVVQFSATGLTPANYYNDTFSVLTTVSAGTTITGFSLNVTGVTSETVRLYVDSGANVPNDLSAFSVLVSGS